MRFVATIAIYVGLCSLVFLTPNAAAGTTVVAATVCILVWLAVRGYSPNRRGLFYGGLAGLAWLAFALGFAWDVPSNRPLESVQMMLIRCYLPLTRPIAQKGSIFQVRSLMDGDYKNYPVRLIPSEACFSRLSVSIMALMLAGGVMFFMRLNAENVAAHQELP